MNEYDIRFEGVVRVVAESESEAREKFSDPDDLDGEVVSATILSVTEVD